MTWPLRAPSRRALVALVVVSAALGARPALAEIFKCSAKVGTPLYQNFPCNIDSLGSVPSQPTVSSTPTSAPVSTSASEKPKGKPAERSAQVSAPMVKPTVATGVDLGMTETQVKAVLGEPDEMLEDEQRTGRVYIWRYGNREDVIFDTKRHVISVQPYSAQQ
jgi:hypothetical protein